MIVKFCGGTQRFHFRMATDDGVFDSLTLIPDWIIPFEWEILPGNLPAPAKPFAPA